jgi:hypothetical protein
MRISSLFRTCLVVGLLPFVTVSYATVINFDDLPATNYVSGHVVEPFARLSDQYQSTLGVTFSSSAGYVAVVNLGLGSATSGTNGIGGVTPDNILTYNRNYPVTAWFTDPSDASIKVSTDYVSLRGDLWGSAEFATLNGYDVDGNLVATTTVSDIGGATLTLSTLTPLIHSVTFLGSSTNEDGIAVDDFTFDSAAVPEPATAILLATGLIGVLRRNRSRRAS